LHWQKTWMPTSVGMTRYHSPEYAGKKLDEIAV
jgi:hypothetical protein